MHWTEPTGLSIRLFRQLMHKPLRKRTCGSAEFSKMRGDEPIGAVERFNLEGMYKRSKPKIHARPDKVAESDTVAELCGLNGRSPGKVDRALL